MSVSERILTYVMGLLYFHGVLKFEDLYAMTMKTISEGMSQDDFRLLLEAAVDDDYGPYVFDMAEDYYFDIEVNDVHWVLAEQRKRDELDYRPVSEEVARWVVEDNYPLLWGDGEKGFFRWLLKRCGNDAGIVLPLFLDYEAAIKNNSSPVDIAEKILEDLDVIELEEVREVAALVKELYTHVPLWTLKGWTLADVL